MSKIKNNRKLLGVFVLGVILLAFSFRQGWYFDPSTPQSGIGWADQTYYHKVAEKLASGTALAKGDFHFQMGYSLLGALFSFFIPQDPFMLVSFILLIASFAFCYFGAKIHFNNIFFLFFLFFLFIRVGGVGSLYYAQEVFLLPWNNQVLFFSFSFFFWAFSIKSRDGNLDKRILFVASIVSGYTVATREEALLFVFPMLLVLLYKSANKQVFYLSIFLFLIAYSPQLLIKYSVFGNIVENVRATDAGVGYIEKLSTYLSIERLGINFVDVVYNSSIRELPDINRDSLLQSNPWFWLSPIGLFVFLIKNTSWKFSSSFAKFRGKKNTLTYMEQEKPNREYWFTYFIVFSLGLLVFYLAGENMSAQKLKYHCLRYISPAYIMLSFLATYVLSEGNKVFRKIALAEKIKNQKWVAYCLAFFVIVVVYGAIPYFSIPTLGQVVWTSGFAKSYVNAGWPSIYAVNFGVPAKAPIAFGLFGAFLQSTFIAFFNMHASDAYAFGAILWLALALWGSVKFNQLLGASFQASAFLSLIYLTLPIIWWHAQYSMISFGFALLPLYVYLGFRVVYLPTESDVVPLHWIGTILSFWGASLLAVFMDGYTYVMFFTATGIIWLIAFFRKDVRRKVLLVRILPTIMFSAFLSYSLYVQFMGIFEFSSSPIEFFRGWGLDISMLVVPTKGILWLWDLLGVSIVRNQQMFFGDASVWVTTFALPLIVVGLSGYWVARKHRFALPLLLLSLVGLYFSLGPSLKINSTRPMDEYGTPLIASQGMPENIAIAPTGSAFIYEQIPGFKNMRATYRWAGLMFTGLLGLSTFFYVELSARGYRKFVVGIFLFLILSNLPNMQTRLVSSHNFRSAMYKMDNDFEELSTYVGENSLVFFAPSGNDFIVNYLASVGNYRAYNIGGDKNLQLASKHWPSAVKNIKIEDNFYDGIREALIDGEADFIVVPYFDMLWGAHRWPWPEEKLESQHQRFSETIACFRNDPSFIVKEENLYSVISLSPDFIDKTFSKRTHLVLDQPVVINASCTETIAFLENGWYSIESWGVWSTKQAELSIPLPPNCMNSKMCGLNLTFWVYSASPSTPKAVLIKVEDVQIGEWIIESSDVQKLLIPLPQHQEEDSQNISLVIQVPEAISPKELGNSPDARTLGMGLLELELVEIEEK